MNNDRFAEGRGRRRAVGGGRAQGIVTDAWLRHVIGIHFDPAGGSAFWREHERELGFSVRHAVRGVADLPLLGPMNAGALASRPLEDFLPARWRARRSSLVTAETGGTTGVPKATAYSEEDFRKAFTDPFLCAARACGFPERANWLWIGPSGPHIIGKAARECARAMGSQDPYAVDFDPRWARKLPRESLAAERYLDHIVRQALRIAAVQSVGVIFGTPAVLERLAEEMPESGRRRIRGIHLGGMAAEGECMDKLQRAFRGAVFLSGYGNTLFGMCPELPSPGNGGFRYYPFFHRLVLRVIPRSGGSAAERLGQDVGYGERGQLVFSRLDESFLILNMVERDSVKRIPPPGVSGFVHDGIRDPEPMRENAAGAAVCALY